MTVRMDADFIIGKQLPPARRAVALDTPFRILVLGNFSGGRAGLPPLGARRPVRVDVDTFDTALAQVAPSLSLEIGDVGGGPVCVSFSSIDDFEPDALFAKLPLFSRMRELRSRLADASTFEQAAAELRSTPVASEVEPSKQPENDAATLERLLGGPASGDRPARSVPPASRAELVVDRLVKGLVAPYIVAPTAHLQRPLIDSLDLAISASMRSLLRHPLWRGLEGRWRALDRFVRQVEMEGGVVLELLDVDAPELLDDFARTQGDIANCALAGMAASRRAASGEDEGWDLIVGLFEFGPSVAELALLAALGAMAAHAGAVYLDSAASNLVDPGSAPTDAPVEARAAERWRSLRESWVAPYIGLVWPRVLARLPFGAKTQPVAGFAFEELADGFGHERLAWRSAALDCASLLAMAFVDDGWAMQPLEHLDLVDLPAWIDRSESPPRMQAVAECFLSEKEAAAAQAQGVMPLVSHRALPHARLMGWQSIASSRAPLAGRWHVPS